MTDAAGRPSAPRWRSGCATSPITTPHGALQPPPLEQELDRHIVHGRCYGMDGALLVIDLDRFAEVNDGTAIAPETAFFEVATVFASACARATSCRASAATNSPS